MGSDPEVRTAGKQLTNEERLDLFQKLLTEVENRYRLVVPAREESNAVTFFTYEALNLFSDEAMDLDELQRSLRRIGNIGDAHPTNELRHFHKEDGKDYPMDVVDTVAGAVSTLKCQKCGEQVSVTEDGGRGFSS